MFQEIVTYLIVIVCLAVAAYKIFNTFKRTTKSCEGCPLSGGSCGKINKQKA